MVGFVKAVERYSSIAGRGQSGHKHQHSFVWLSHIRHLHLFWPVSARRVKSFCLSLVGSKPREEAAICRLREN